MAAVMPWPGPNVRGRVGALPRARVGLPLLRRLLGLRVGAERDRRPRLAQAPPRPGQAPLPWVTSVPEPPLWVAPSVHPALGWLASPCRRLLEVLPSTHSPFST